MTKKKTHVFRLKKANVQLVLAVVSSVCMISIAGFQRKYRESLAPTAPSSQPYALELTETSCTLDFNVVASAYSTVTLSPSPTMSVGPTVTPVLLITITPSPTVTPYELSSTPRVIKIPVAPPRAGQQGYSMIIIAVIGLAALFGAFILFFI